jgi:hypothetical protein
MPGGHHPRSTRQHRTEVIPTPQLGFPRRGVADIDYITVCLGLPIPPISREHGVRLKGLA